MIKFIYQGLVFVLAFALAILAIPFQTTVNAQDGTTPTTVFLPAVRMNGTPASPTGSGTFSIAATDATKNELDGGSTPFVFTVTRAGQLDQVTKVEYAVSGSGATTAAPDDFAGSSLPQGVLQFGAGENSKPLIINVRGDTATEPDEGFTVTLVNPSGSAQIVGSSAVGVILNDEDPSQVGSGTFSITADVTVKDELNSGSVYFNFSVTRAGDTSRFTTVNYAVSGSGANVAAADDFTGGELPQGELRFSPGESSKPLIVMVQGDNVVEPDEGFTVALVNPSGSAQIVGSSAAGNIRNDDTTPSTDLALTASDTEQAEGDDSATTYVFKVKRSGVTDGLTTVDYGVGGSGAAPATADDFVGGVFPSGTLTFTFGESERTLAIDVQGDTGIEDDEGFVVTLANASGGANIILNDATVAIKNDDSTDLSISLADPDKPEGDSGCTEYSFVVTRIGDTSGATSVDYVLGPIENPVDVNDYCDWYGGVTPNGTITFAPNESAQLLLIYMQGDTEIEDNEDFVVTLSNASGGARIIGAEAIADIRNDDTAVPVSLSIDTATGVVAAGANAVDLETVPEGAIGITTTFSFIVTRSGNPLPDATVRYFASGDGDNPANGADFAGSVYPTGSIHFDADAPFAQLSIIVRGDEDEEPDEGFAVTLEDPSDGALIVDGGAVGLIKNDDGWSPEDATAINSIMFNVGPVDSPTTKPDIPTTLPPRSDGYYQYTYQQHDVVGSSESIANFGKDASILFVGNLFEGNSVNEYAYVPISLARMPFKISLSLETSQSSAAVPQSISGTVLPDALGNVGIAEARDAIKKILDGLIGISPAARVSWESQQIYSESQLNAFAKTNVEYGDFGFNGTFDFSETGKRTKIVGKYEQVYFTVDMNTPLDVSDLFDARKTDVTEVTAKLTGKNPMYLSSIAYGLVAYVFVESNESASKLEAAMKATYDGVADVEVEGGVTYAELLKDAKIRVLVYGGSTKNLANNYDTYDGFKQVVDSSTSYGPDSPGVPIAYSFLRVADKTPVKTTYAAQYVSMVPVAMNELVQIQVNELHIGWADDNGPGDDVEIDRIAVSVDGFTRASIFDPLADPPVLGIGWEGENMDALSRSAPDWSMHEESRYFEGPRVILKFPTALPNRWDASALRMSGYARDYDSGWLDDNEEAFTPGGSVTLRQSEWWPPENRSEPAAYPKYVGPFNTNHIVPIQSSEFEGYYVVNVQRVTPPPDPRFNQPQ